MIANSVVVVSCKAFLIFFLYPSFLYLWIVANLEATSSSHGHYSRSVTCTIKYLLNKRDLSLLFCPAR